MEDIKQENKQEEKVLTNPTPLQALSEIGRAVAEDPARKRRTELREQATPQHIIILFKKEDLQPKLDQFWNVWEKRTLDANKSLSRRERKRRGITEVNKVTTLEVVGSGKRKKKKGKAPIRKGFRDKSLPKTRKEIEEQKTLAKFYEPVVVPIMEAEIEKVGGRKMLTYFHMNLIRGEEGYKLTSFFYFYPRIEFKKPPQGFKVMIRGIERKTILEGVDAIINKAREETKFEGEDEDLAKEQGYESLDVWREQAEEFLYKREEQRYEEDLKMKSMRCLLEVSQIDPIPIVWVDIKVDEAYGELMIKFKSARNLFDILGCNSEMEAKMILRKDAHKELVEHLLFAEYAKFHKIEGKDENEVRNLAEKHLTEGVMKEDLKMKLVPEEKKEVKDGSMG